MKAAKRFDFLAAQRARLSLNVERSFFDPDAPSDENFYRWTWHALKHDCARAQIGIALLDAESARRMNQQYRNKDYATNVLSFSLDAPENFLSGSLTSLTGDLVLCPEVIAAEARAQGKLLHEHYAHLIVHGVLHLMGHDHETDSEAKIMEALEIRLMLQLGYAHPYLTDAN